MIGAVRASDDGPHEHVRVGRPGVKILEPTVARDPARVRARGREGRSPVVHVQGVPVAEPDHVRRPRRVVPEDVVHLLPGLRDEALGRDRGGPARDGHAVRAQVLGVGQEEERSRRDVLEVARAPLVEKSS